MIGGVNDLDGDLRIITMRGNVISGNTGTGLDIRGETSSNNAAEGNFLGIDSSGSRRLANQIGVAIREGATLNTIGGSSL